jgi:hypothetical protein
MVNPGAQSLLPRYDPAALAPERVIHVLAAHGYAQEAAGTR